MQANVTGLKLLIGYDVLVLLRPAAAAGVWRAVPPGSADLRDRPGLRAEQPKRAQPGQHLGRVGPLRGVEHGVRLQVVELLRSGPGPHQQAPGPGGAGTGQRSPDPLGRR